MSTFRIISFDGGGIRGSLSTTILRRLVQSNPKLLEETNLFAGTSTGALIALSLASGVSSKEIDDLYSYENIKNIFSPKHINLFKPKYSNKNLKKLITTIIPEKTKLSDLEKMVFIPSFNVKGLTENRWQGIFFNNIKENITYNASVVDAALASSAAPTFFPSHNNYIDGGIVTNSPSIASLIAVMHSLKDKYKIDDFRLLSISTGDNPKRIISNTKNWGILQWVFAPFRKVKFPIINILLDNTSPLEDLYCKELLGSNYMRINPILMKEIEMDDYKYVPYLKRLGETYNLDKANNFIREYYLK